MGGSDFLHQDSAPKAVIFTDQKILSESLCGLLDAQGFRTETARLPCLPGAVGTSQVSKLSGAVTPPFSLCDFCLTRS